MAQPAAAVAITVGIDRRTDNESTPVEVTKPVMVVMVAPSNGAGEVGRGFAEVGLDGR